MSDKEDNSDHRDDNHNNFDDDSDEEGGGMKPGYSVEDLFCDVEDGDGEEDDDNEGQGMTASQSNTSQSDSAIDVVDHDRDNNDETDDSKASKNSLPGCHGNDETTSEFSDSLSRDIDKSVSTELSKSGKEEDEEIYENALSIQERKRLSRSSASEEPKTPNNAEDSVPEDENYENVGEKKTRLNSFADHQNETVYDDVADEDEGRKGGTLVPGQHLSNSEHYENIDDDRHGSGGGRAPNYEEDGWASSDFEEYDDTGNQSQQSQESLTHSGDGSSGSYKETKKRRFPWRRSQVSGPQDLASPPANPSGTMLDKITAQFQKIRRNSDVEAPGDFGVVEVAFNYTKHPPPELPPVPEGLSHQQLKRRHIVSTIIESEKSYSASLLRLVEDYEKPLLEAKPQILMREAIRTIFFKIRDILQCHNMFQIELSAMASNWDTEEKIGDVFTASFSKSLVFDVYKEFVVNFSSALDTAKKHARRQAAFGDFLNQKLEASEDRLSLFGLLVKPVQRFPQFIMLLQDLLRFTSKDHHDRLSLQLALSELESLTEQLNEAKRDSESHLEIRRFLDNLVGFGSVMVRVDEETSFLVRQDDVIEIKQKNGEPQERQRRLLLLNDQLICTEVHRRDSVSSEKFTFHWSIPIKEIEVIESTLPSSYTVHVTPGKTLISAKKMEASLVPSDNNPYKKELDDMIHDLTILQSMSQLADQLRLKCSSGFDPEMLRIQTRSLQTRIGQKCNIEHSLLTLSLPTKFLLVSTDKLLKEQVTKHIGKVGRTKSLNNDIRVQFTFQFGSMVIKHNWLQELQDTKLATDPMCHPAWHTSETNQPSHRNPQFHPPLLLDITKEDSKKLLKSKKKSKDMIQCATSVTIPSADDYGLGVQHLWVCNGDQSKGQIAIVSLNTNQPCVVESFKVCDSLITSVESVPTADGAAGEQVWMGTDDKKIVICDVVESDRSKKRRTVTADGVVTCLKYQNAKVYAGTRNGSVLVYCFKDGDWNWKKPLKEPLGNTKVSCLLPVNLEMWVSCNLTIHKLTVSTSTKVSSVKKESHDLSSECGQIECMVKAGVGLLVAFSNRAVIRLYHMETLQHLQDINIASAVTSLLEGKQLVSPFSEDRKLFSLSITYLLSGNGLLWVGTNYGFVLTLPLPRLEGVPQVKRRPAVSYHAQNGPVKFLVSIQSGNTKLASILSDQQRNVGARLLENIDKKADLGNDELAPVRQRDSKTFEKDEEEGRDVGKNGTLLKPNQWNSSPDLRDLSDLDFDHDELYKNLLQGVDADIDAQLLQSLTRKRPKTSSFLGNLSSVSNRFSKSVRKTFTPAAQTPSSDVKFHSVIPYVTNENAANDSNEKPTTPAAESSGCSTSEAPAFPPPETCVDEAEGSPDVNKAENVDPNAKNPEEKQPVEQRALKDSTVPASSVVVLPGVTRRAAYARRFVVVSGGEGYVNWKEKKPFDKSYEDICLLHWKC